MMRAAFSLSLFTVHKRHFEEMRAQETFDGASLPRTGFLDRMARNNFRIGRQALFATMLRRMCGPPLPTG